jgi:hypothetical protein
MQTEPVDLSRFDVESGADKGSRLDLVDKFGKPSGEWIFLLGADSREYDTRLSQHSQRRLDRLSKSMAGVGPKIEANEGVTEAIERLVVCTKDWSFIVGNGEGKTKFPCTPENAEKIYRSSKLIREQASAFINDRANFTQA